jgi:hypothetical protein
MIRTLPNEDQLDASTPDAQLTWNWIYANVLADYDVLNPIMSRSADPAINLPLHGRQAMEANAAKIKRTIDADAFESAGYIPETRDLVRDGATRPETVPASMPGFSTRSERVATDQDAPRTPDNE